MELWFIFLHAAAGIATKNEPYEMYLSSGQQEEVVHLLKF